MEKPYQKTTLDNGLRIITVPMPTARSVSGAIFIGAGVRYEEKKINGLSHFLEHMMFKGTKKRPTSRDIAVAIEGMGGRLNGGTDAETTTYWFKVPKGDYEKGFEILSDMLLNSLFASGEIDRERGVILEEINRREDSYEEKIWEVFEALLYPNQALGRTGLGKKEVIQKLQRKEMLAYFQSLYVPQNMVVCFAGNFKTEKVEKLVEEKLKMSRKKLGRSWEKAKEKQDAPQVKLYPKKTEQAHLCLGTRSIRLGHKDQPVAAVLNAILGRGMSSRLFINIRERRGLCYHISSHNEYFRDTGSWTCYAGLRLEKIEEAISLILEELKTIKKEPVSKKELAEAKEKIKGPLLFNLETTDGAIDYYGRQELLEEKIETPEEWIKRVEKVTADDIMRVAQDIFQNKKLNLAMISPFEDSSQFEKLLNVE